MGSRLIHARYHREFPKLDLESEVGDEVQVLTFNKIIIFLQNVESTSRRTKFEAQNLWVLGSGYHRPGHQRNL